MRKMFLALAVTILVAAGRPIMPGAREDSSRTRGTIWAPGGDSITVKVRDQEMKFAVDAKTVVEARERWDKSARRMPRAKPARS